MPRLSHHKNSPLLDNMELIASIFQNLLPNQLLIEVEHQLTKERQLRSELMQSFEEQDREKEKIVCSLEKEIKQLKDNISKLKQNKTLKSHLINNTSEMADMQTQTDPRPYEIDEHNNQQLPLILELNQLKTRQDSMEHSMKVLHDQFQKHDQAKVNAYIEQSLPTTPRHTFLKIPRLNEGKKNVHKRGNNHRSVSLQIAKSKNAQTGFQEPKNGYTITNTLIADGNINQTNSVLDSHQPSSLPTSKESNSAREPLRKPPMNAKPRATDETLEEFYTKHIDYYIKSMTPIENTLTPTYSQPLSSPEPGQQAPVQVDISHGIKSRKGGVAIYVKDSLQPKTETLNVSHHCKELTCEVAAVKVTSGKEHLYILGIYRSPSEKLDEALDIISNIIEEVKADNHPLVILGDINVNRLVPNNDARKLEEMLTSHNMTRLPLPPTEYEFHNSVSLYTYCV
ncbi:hypothetical protein J6590_092899 [Homalodisca vitripennis]|nr:hypothetical protein J6590_092899 [Homalodisca vitripennis]